MLYIEQSDKHQSMYQGQTNSCTWLSIYSNVHFWQLRL